MLLLPSDWSEQHNTKQFIYSQSGFTLHKMLRIQTKCYFLVISTCCTFKACQLAFFWMILHPKVQLNNLWNLTRGKTLEEYIVWLQDPQQQLLALRFCSFQAALLAKVDTALVQQRWLAKVTHEHKHKKHQSTNNTGIPVHLVHCFQQSRKPQNSFTAVVSAFDPANNFGGAESVPRKIPKFLTRKKGGLNK